MEKGRNYTYKGNTYTVLGDCRMKDSKKNWVDAVRYQDVNNKEKGEFVRSEKQFLDRFIPTELKVGDRVLVVSMGKKVGVDTVGKIEESQAYLTKTVMILPLEIKKGGYIDSFENKDFFFFNAKIEKEQVKYQ